MASCPRLANHGMRSLRLPRAKILDRRRTAALLPCLLVKALLPPFLLSVTPLFAVWPGCMRGQSCRRVDCRTCLRGSAVHSKGSNRLRSFSPPAAWPQIFSPSTLGLPRGKFCGEGEWSGWLGPGPGDSALVAASWPGNERAGCTHCTALQQCCTPRNTL